MTRSDCRRQAIATALLREAARRWLEIDFGSGVHPGGRVQRAEISVAGAQSGGVG